MAVNFAINYGNILITHKIIYQAKLLFWYLNLGLAIILSSSPEVAID